MTFIVCIGRFIIRNSGIFKVTNRKRGCSVESVEPVWPLPKKTRLRVKSKEERQAEEKYLNSKITFSELQEVRAKHPPTEP